MRRLLHVLVDQSRIQRLQRENVFRLRFVLGFQWRFLFRDVFVGDSRQPLE
jgi:hypothetical protein